MPSIPETTPHRWPRHPRLRCIALAGTLLLGSCDRPDRPAPPAPHAATFVSQSPQHLAAVLRAAIGPLPSVPLGGDIAEVQLGAASSDLVPGPADRVTYLRATVAPDAVTAWRARLTRAAQRPAHAAPLCTCPWWPDAARFQSMEFFETGPSVPASGWLGFDVRTATVFLLTSTR